MIINRSLNSAASLIRCSVTKLTETGVSVCQLLVYVEDRWPRLATAVRGTNFLLLLFELWHGLPVLIAGGPSALSLWTLVLSLMLYGLQAVLVLLETILFLVRKRR